MTHERKWPWLAALLIVAAGWLVYANSLGGPFIFDDHISIEESPNVRALWPLTEAMSANAGSGASGRPLVALSLALNYAAGEFEVYGYHLLNVLAHIASALALFGLLRRALVRAGSAELALPAALATAVLWVVHPLNTDALNQVVSRSEIFVAGFFLFALYAADRSFGTSRPKLWSGLAVVAAACAMMSKEVAVAVPLMVLLYDRTFVSGGFAKALTSRKGFYALLASIWLVLWLSIASGDRGLSVGFGQSVSSLDYMRTQAQGIVHYLRLAFWPSGLVIDYSGWPFVREWGPAIVPGLVVVALFASSLWLFVTRRAVAVPALLFFAALAPSSSFIPLTGERLAEHRMYLPLAALLSVVLPVLFVLARRLSQRKGLAIAALLAFFVAAPLAWATRQRNEVYRSELGLWEDTLRKYPDNARAHDYIAAILLGEGRYTEALPHAEEAVRLDPELDSADYNLATIAMQLGDSKRALLHYRRAERFRSGRAAFHGNFGVVLAQEGGWEEAFFQLRRALELEPNYITARRNLGLLLAERGKAREALEHLNQVLASQEDIEVQLVVVRLLAGASDSSVRDGAHALRVAQTLVQSAPRDPRAYDALGMAYAELGRFDEAIGAGERSLEGAQALKRNQFTSQVAARVELYRAGKPYRE